MLTTHVKISQLVSLQTSRQQVVFARLVTSCQQVWNKLSTTCNSLVDIVRLDVNALFYSGVCDIKAWFHDSEILREKLFMRNTDGWAWMILLNSLTCFAFAVSRIEFYSLGEANFLLAKREFDGIIHVQPSVFRINSFSRSISLSWNQTFKIWQLVASLQTSRQQVVFARLVTSCQQVWNKLSTTCNSLVDIDRLDVNALFYSGVYDIS